MNVNNLSPSENRGLWLLPGVLALVLVAVALMVSLRRPGPIAVAPAASAAISAPAALPSAPVAPVMPQAAEPVVDDSGYLVAIDPAEALAAQDRTDDTP